MIDSAALIAANAPLNAFIDWADTDSVIDGPTVGVKANIAVAGLPWTAGMALYRHRIAQRDAQVVARLRQSGYVVLGSLNMDEAALGAKTDNPWFGDTHNPHRIGFTAGGSSGGSGAAVAAGLCTVALGTDTMGSIRIPASYCGVYGYKPANAEISQDGLEPCEPELDAVGLLARSLLVLEDAATTGAGASFLPRPAVSQTAVVTLAGLGGVDCHPDVLAVYDRSCGTLHASHAVNLPHALSRVRYAGFIRTARSLSAAFADAEPALLSDRFKRLISYGPRRSSSDWAADQLVLRDTAQAVREAVAAHGFLLLPTTPGLAFPLADDAPANQADFTCLANIANLPALSIPAGLSNGLPIGVQLICAEGAEGTMFDLARTIAVDHQPQYFFKGA